MKRLLIAACIPCSLFAKGPLLTDPILKKIDGIRGVYDGSKVNKSLWLMREIKQIHAGIMKVNSKGEPDCSRQGTPSDIVFNGKKRTIQELIALEKNLNNMSAAERKEFKALFQKIKIYFGLCHNIILADARGAQSMIIKLIEEFCKLYNRPHCLLLKWEEGSEQEMYENDVVNFSVFYEVTTDLKDFLAVLTKSCPKAFADFRKTNKKA